MEQLKVGSLVWVTHNGTWFIVGKNEYILDCFPYGIIVDVNEDDICEVWHYEGDTWYTILVPMEKLEHRDATGENSLEAYE